MRLVVFAGIDIISGAGRYPTQTSLHCHKTLYHTHPNRHQLHRLTRWRYMQKRLRQHKRLIKHALSGSCWYLRHRVDGTIWVHGCVVSNPALRRG